MSRIGGSGGREDRGWSRLKPLSVDYLESIGLPSKGDTRLLDHRTQETYFAKIVERYNHVISTKGSDNGLEDVFASLSLDGDSSKNSKTAAAMSQNVSLSNNNGQQTKPAPNEMATILMAMRKIREAIVASARKDSFALKAYIFIIRSTIPLGHMESYHPALLHLLQKIHPVVPLTEPQYHEFLGYYILDLACRQNELAAAYHAKYRYQFKDAKIEAVLKALVHRNWCMFWMLQGLDESRQSRLMQWAEEGMRSHALKCLAKSYMSVERKYLEQAVRRAWENFQEKDDLGWQLNGDVVTIRRISRK